MCRSQQRGAVQVRLGGLLRCSGEPISPPLDGLSRKLEVRSLEAARSHQVTSRGCSSALHLSRFAKVSVHQIGLLVFGLAALAVVGPIAIIVPIERPSPGLHLCDTTPEVSRGEHHLFSAVLAIAAPDETVIVFFEAHAKSPI